jgi:hypothetical protein
MAPPKSSIFSVRVVLPASGWEMMANVLRRLISVLYFIALFLRNRATGLSGSCSSGGSGFTTGKAPDKGAPESGAKVSFGQ